VLIIHVCENVFKFYYVRNTKSPIRLPANRAPVNNPKRSRSVLSEAEGLLYHLRHNSRVNTLAVFADGYHTEPVTFVGTKSFERIVVL
jgi:hypothetical protein